MGIVLRIITCFNTIVNRVLDILIKVFISLMCTLVFIQVLNRYVFHFNGLWIQEVSVILFIWSIMLGSAIGVRDMSHMTLETLSEKNRNRKSIRFIKIMIIIIVAAVLTVKGVSMTILANSQYSSYGIRMSIYMACMPIGGVIMLTNAIERMIKLFNNSEKEVSLATDSSN